MYKTTVEYEDFNGEKKKRTLYFNLSQSELTELKYESNGALEDKIVEIVATKNRSEMMLLFTKLLKMAYGEKSEDGEYFIKNEEVYNRFKFSNAYDAFLEKLVESDSELENFIKYVMPKKLSDKVDMNEVKKKTEEYM